jgi:hypothetical protein
MFYISLSEQKRRRFFDENPAAMRWILEIHLRDPLGRFGAFFEAMLLDDSHYV